MSVLPFIVCAFGHRILVAVTLVSAAHSLDEDAVFGDHGQWGWAVRYAMVQAHARSSNELMEEFHATGII